MPTTLEEYKQENERLWILVRELQEQIQELNRLSEQDEKIYQFWNGHARLLESYVRSRAIGRKIPPTLKTYIEKLLATPPHEDIPMNPNPETFDDLISGNLEQDLTRLEALAKKRAEVTEKYKNDKELLEHALSLLDKRKEEILKA